MKAVMKLKLPLTSGAFPFFKRGWVFPYSSGTQFVSIKEELYLTSHSCHSPQEQILSFCKPSVQLPRKLFRLWPVSSQTRSSGNSGDRNTFLDLKTSSSFFKTFLFPFRVKQDSLKRLFLLSLRNFLGVIPPNALFFILKPIGGIAPFIIYTKPLYDLGIVQSYQTNLKIVDPLKSFYLGFQISWWALMFPIRINGELKGGRGLIIPRMRSNFSALSLWI